MAFCSTQSVIVGSYPDHVAVNPQTNKIYVAFQIPGNLAVVDGATLSSTLVPAGDFENDIAIDELRNQIYVADPTGDQLVIIDGQSNAVRTVGGTGSYLWRIAVNPLTNEIFAVNLISQDATIFSGPAVALPVPLLEVLQPKSASN
jgi:DNA-binding beta-propeller fold protein YncE